MKKILIILLLLVIKNTIWAQTNCDQALQYKDKIVIKHSGNTRKDIHDFFKSEYNRENSSQKGTAVGIRIPIKKLKLGANYNNNKSEYENIVNAINSSNEYVFSDEFINDVYQEILKPDAYEKWLSCIQSKLNAEIELAKIELQLKNSQNSNLIGEITDVTSDGFILKIRWKPTAGVNSVKLKPIISDGATYNKDAFDINEELGSEFISIPFYKIRGKEVVIAINTVGNRGSFSIKEKKSSINFGEDINVQNIILREGYRNDKFKLLTPEINSGMEAKLSINSKVVKSKILSSAIEGKIKMEIVNTFKGYENPIDALGSKGDPEYTSEEREFSNNLIGTQYDLTFRAIASSIFKQRNGKYSLQYKILDCSGIKRSKNIVSQNDCQNSRLTMFLRNIVLAASKITGQLEIQINGFGTLTCPVNLNVEN